MSAGTTTECCICGETFVKKKKNHKYCSENCRWKASVNNLSEKKRLERLARMRTWNHENRDKRRDYHYRRMFGLTLEEYNAMLETQSGCCAICGEPPKEHHRALAVDHDHGTGEIFGLLCTPCNKNLIGRIRNPELFEKAAEYLKKGTGRFVPEQFRKGPKKRRKTPRKKTNG